MIDTRDSDAHPYANVERWLADYLDSGPVPAASVLSDAALQGITRERLYRAKSYMGIRSKKLSAEEARSRGLPVGSYLWQAADANLGRLSRYPVMASRAQWGAVHRIVTRALDLDKETGWLRMHADNKTDARSALDLMLRAESRYQAQLALVVDRTGDSMIESAEEDGHDGTEVG